jgi:hypothetical protein
MIGSDTGWDYSFVLTIRAFQWLIQPPPHLFGAYDAKAEIMGFASRKFPGNDSMRRSR